MSQGFKPTTDNHNNKLIGFWQNHVGVRLAACLFLVIFLAQALWIYPAYQQFERDELTRLSHTGLAVMESLLILTSADIAPAELTLLGETLTYKTPLKGAQIYDYEGSLISEFGEQPFYTPAELNEQWGDWMTPRLEGGARVEMAWIPDDTYTDYLIVARLDSAYIQQALDDFLGIMLRMVFIVTFIATFVLMWILRRPTFRPVLEKITGVENLGPSAKLR